jgi:putative NADH-flavin reductase
MAGKVEGLVDALIDRAEQQGFRLGVLGGVSSVLVAAGGPTLFEVRPPAAEIMPEVRTGMALKEQLERSPEGVDWFYVSPAASFGAWAQVPDTGAYRVSEDVLLTDGEGNSAISAADLAKAVVDELERPRFRRRRLHVAH